MKNNILTKKILCVLLAMAITSTSFALAFGHTKENITPQKEATEVTEISNDKGEETTEDSGIEKEETVYVNLDPNGNIESQIVSSKIHSDEPNVVVNDRSELDEIMPIKGGTLKENKNGELVWNIDDNDVYYRGKTDKKMPMSVEISYYLDGEEYSPEEIAGKSGKLRIELSVKNNDTQTVNILGKPTKIYKPLAVMIGAILKDDVFSNVEVDEGNVVADGSNFIVSLIAMPGLKESLDIDNISIDELRDIEFHDNFVITADVKDFEMGPIAVVATPEFPDMDTDGDTIDDMRADLVDLQDMQNDLQEMDGDHEIRSLFTDTEKSDAARLLIDDIFELYDLNRTILDVLPKYITSDNVKVLENFIDDIELVDLDEIEDSEVLDDLDELLVKNDNPININDLKSMVKSAKKYTEALKVLVKDINEDNQKSKIEKLFSSIMRLGEAIEDCNPAIKQQFLGIINDQQKLGAFVNGGLQAVSMLPKTASDEEDTLVTDEVELNENTPSEKTETDSADKEKSDTQGKSDKENSTDDTDAQDKSNTDKSTDGTDKNVKTDDSTTDSNKQDAEKSKDDTKVVEDKKETEDTEVVEKKQEATDTKVEDKGDKTSDKTAEVKNAEQDVKSDDKKVEAESKVVEKQSEAKESKTTETKANDTKTEKQTSSNNEKSEETSSEKTQVLAANTIDPKSAESMKQAAIQQEIGKILGAFNDVLTSYNDLGSQQKAILKELISNDTILDLQNALRYFEENEENLELMEKILNETDSREVRRISRAISHLRENVDDFKPIIFKLQRDIKKPGMRDSLRESPEMIRTLVKMNGDIDDNRNISDILKKAVSKENSETLKDMIETLDRLIDENAIDGYVENVDDIKELIERKDALVSLSDNQQSYSGADENAETSVKFIMKTDEIKKPEPKKEIKTVKEEPKSKIKQFFDKIFG